MGSEYHYMSVKIPRRFYNQEFKDIISDTFGIKTIEVEEHMDHNLSNNYTEFEIDDTKVQDDIAENLLEAGIPASIYQGKTWEYEPFNYYVFPKGDPKYPDGHIAKVKNDLDDSHVVNTYTLQNMLKKHEERMENQIVTMNEAYIDLATSLQTLIDENDDMGVELLEYYAVETDLGRNPDAVSGIDQVLKDLDEGTIDDAEAMKRIKEIKEGAK